MVRRSLALLLALFALPLSTAQAAALAQVQGTLRLSGGTPAAGVEVRLLDLSSGRVTSLRSDDAGLFRSSVAPGVYAVEAGRGYEIARGPRLVSATEGQAVSAALVVAPAAAPATQLTVEHDPKGCLLADQHPEIDAAIRPATAVKYARVYFKAAREGEFHYVEMIPEIGRYIACLPEPHKDAGPIDYYVEAAAADGTIARSPGASSLVIERNGECPADRQMAVICPCRVPVSVFNTAGQPAFPTAFGGVLGQITTGVSTTTTGALVTIGASIIGVGIQIGSTGPASPSR